MGQDNSALNALLATLSSRLQSGRTQTAKPNIVLNPCMRSPFYRRPCPYCENKMSLAEDAWRCSHCGYDCSAEEWELEEAQEDEG